MNMQNETDFEAIFDAARKVVEKQSHYYDAIALKNTVCPGLYIALSVKK